MRKYKKIDRTNSVVSNQRNQLHFNIPVEHYTRIKLNNWLLNLPAKQHLAVPGRNQSTVYKPLIHLSTAFPGVSWCHKLQYILLFSFLVWASDLVLNPATHKRHPLSSRSRCLLFFSGLMLSWSVRVFLKPTKNRISDYSSFCFYSSLL